MTPGSNQRNLQRGSEINWPSRAFQKTRLAAFLPGSTRRPPEALNRALPPHSRWRRSDERKKIIKRHVGVFYVLMWLQLTGCQHSAC